MGNNLISGVKPISEEFIRESTTPRTDVYGQSYTYLRNTQNGANDANSDTYHALHFRNKHYNTRPGQGPGGTSYSGIMGNNQYYINKGDNGRYMYNIRKEDGTVKSGVDLTSIPSHVTTWIRDTYNSHTQKYPGSRDVFDNMYSNETSYHQEGGRIKPLRMPVTHYDSLEMFEDGGQVFADYVIDPDEIRRRQAWAESTYKRNAVSGANAKGIFQIMPATHESYIASMGEDGDLFDPVYNRKVRDWTIEDILRREWINKGNPSDAVKWAKVLAAYNRGPQGTLNALNKAKAAGVDIYNSFDWLSYLPTETQNYVNWIVRRMSTGASRNEDEYNKSRYLYDEIF